MMRKILRIAFLRCQIVKELPLFPFPKEIVGNLGHIFNFYAIIFGNVINRPY